ncbi:hypothetical protein OGATHE_004670 [Ogataea polymorpha]|uniref:Uncharacterized protein n=1 Tax=Ogataea polymorpha TaxID=460523 RepID=A0A9P8T2E3_9ASCO|nr:hypothetical protein OGATHE_004670 [Ogataea polymorpha]
MTSKTHEISKILDVNGAATDASASLNEIPTSAAFSAPQSLAPSPQKPTVFMIAQFSQNVLEHISCNGYAVIVCAIDIQRYQTDGVQLRIRVIDLSPDNRYPLIVLELFKRRNVDFAARFDQAALARDADCSENVVAGAHDGAQLGIFKVFQRPFGGTLQTVFENQKADEFQLRFALFTRKLIQKLQVGQVGCVRFFHSLGSTSNHTEAIVGVFMNLSLGRKRTGDTLPLNLCLATKSFKAASSTEFSIMSQLVNSNVFASKGSPTISSSTFFKDWQRSLRSRIGSETRTPIKSKPSSVNVPVLSKHMTSSFPPTFIRVGAMQNTLLCRNRESAKLVPIVNVAGKAGGTTIVMRSNARRVIVFHPSPSLTKLIAETTKPISAITVMTPIYLKESR